MSVARDLARYAIGLKFSDLPQEVVHEAKRALLDTLGCAFGGYSSKASQIMQQTVKDIGGAQESTVIGSGLKTSCLNASMVNGVMVRYLDYNDTFAVPMGGQLQGGHPSEVIPAALAVAERQRSTGAELIEAMVVGYELSGRFTECILKTSLEVRGWNGALRAVYVVPLMVGKLLGLNEEQMENAVGIAGSHDMVLGILDAPAEPYTMAKNSRFPFAAGSGIMGALLAQRGYTGPARVIEGQRGFVQTVMNGEFDLKKFVQGDGRYKILDTAYKLITADYTTHGHLTATLTLVKQHDIKPEDVVGVKLRAGNRDVEHTGDWAKRYPTNKETADHSSYWLTAIAIMYRAVGPKQFTRRTTATRM
ncbi:MAG: MmgE/PrpD family protein [Chloroflexi bacterium]|nr:MmgE/PrpD family protein [Chloroflexota bacterium]